MADRKIIPLTGIRGIIAKKMEENLNKTAQLSFFTDVDATALIAARQSYKDVGKKVGYEDLIIKALVKTVADFPEFNAVETDKGVEIQFNVNVSCAISLENGLIAPAIFNCEKLSVTEIAEKRRDLVERAKKNKVTIQEHTGGTISITNLGLTRVRHFTPILSYPQQVIIAIGQIVKRPWVNDDDTITVKSIIGVSITVDHRTIDGAPAGNFMTRLAENIETIAQV